MINKRNFILRGSYICEKYRYYGTIIYPAILLAATSKCSV